MSRDKVTRSQILERVARQQELPPKGFHMLNECISIGLVKVYLPLLYCEKVLNCLREPNHVGNCGEDTRYIYKLTNLGREKMRKG